MTTALTYFTLSLAQGFQQFKIRAEFLTSSDLKIDFSRIWTVGACRMMHTSEKIRCSACDAKTAWISTITLHLSPNSGGRVLDSDALKKGNQYSSIIQVFLLGRLSTANVTIPAIRPVAVASNSVSSTSRDYNLVKGVLPIFALACS